MIKEIKTLRNQLANIVSEVARNHSNETLQRDPDHLEERLKAWHQFGLVTHSRLVSLYLGEGFEGIVPQNLNPHLRSIDDYRARRIKSFSRADLLSIAGLFHDFGKIGVFGGMEKDRDHESYTIEMMSRDPIHSLLSGIGVDDDCFSYMGSVIRASGQFGKKVRDVIKDELGSYNLATLDKDDVLNPFFRRISGEYPHIGLDLGFFFLSDSYAKTDIRISANRDEEISGKEGRIREELVRRGLSERLIKGVMQFPINIKLAERYISYKLNSIL